MEKLFVFLNLMIVLILTASHVPVSEAILNCSTFAALNSFNGKSLQNAEARLRACFAANPYDTTQLPYPQTALPLVLQFDWSLVNLLSFKDGVLDVLCQLMLQWTDPMRQWAITELPVSFIEIPITEIWYPRFFAYASKQKFIFINPSDQSVHLTFNGNVLVGILGQIESKCNINLWNFPFDTQTCEISYLNVRQFVGLNGMDVVLVKSPTTYRFKYFPNDEWEVINVKTIENNVSVSQYSSYSNGSLSEHPVFVFNNLMNGFTVSISLRRFNNYYLVNVFAPIIVLSVLDMLPFAIEDKAHEKLLCALTIVSGFMFVQGIVADLLPKSEVTPYLALYVAGSLIVSGASIFAEGFCYYICQLSGSPNKVVRIVILKGFGFLLYPSKWIALIKRCYVKIKIKKQAAKVSDSVTVLKELQTTSSEAIATDVNVSAVELETALATGTVHETHARESSPDAVSVGSELFTSSDSAHANQCPPQTIYSVEWLRVAHVMNRVFALLHLVAFVTLIAVFLIPIVESSETSSTN